MPVASPGLAAYRDLCSQGQGVKTTFSQFSFLCLKMS